MFTTRYDVKPAQLPPGKYRNIMGNVATALGLVAAAKKSGLQLFLGQLPDHAGQRHPARALEAASSSA